MTCKCGSIFCWLCGKTIGGYSHFSYIGCELFQGTQQDVENPVRQIPRAALEIRARLAVNPDLVKMQRHCPACKQNNLKVDNNNHIKCWNCKANFCFICNHRLLKSISEHFKGPCKQHS